MLLSLSYRSSDDDDNCTNRTTPLCLFLLIYSLLFSHNSWRPRPKNLLSADEKKKVIKNLRKYEKEFEKEDKIKRQELNQEVLQQRFRLAEEFLALLNRNKALSREAKATRVSLRDGYDSDDNRNYDINVVTEEQVLKTSEQIIG